MRSCLKALSLVPLSLLFSFPVSLYPVANSFDRATAQTSDARKPTREASPKELADQLFQQGIEQLHNVQNGQFQHREAVASWEKALALYRELKDQRGEIATLVQLSYGYYLLNQYQKAVDALQLPLALARQSDDSQSVGIYLGGLGEGYSLLKQYPKAIQVLQEALQIAQQAGDRQQVAITLESLIKAQQALGQTQQASQSQQQLEAVQQQLVQRQQAEQLLQKGWQQFKAGQLETARQTWETAQSIYGTIQDHRGEWQFLSQMAEGYRYYGQYEQALQTQQQALAIAQQMKYRRDQAAALSGLGTVYIFQGQPQQAKIQFQQALAIYWRVGDRTNESEALRSLGLAADLQGNAQEAAQFNQQSLAIARLFGGRKAEANFARELGLVYNLLGKYQRAVQFLDQALQIYQQLRLENTDREGARVEDLLEESDGLNSLGAAYQSLGAYQSAIQTYQKALKLAQQFSSQGGFIGKPLRGLGNAYYSLGQYQKALDLYQEGLKTIGKDRNFRAVFLTDLGHVYLAQKKPQQAIEAFQAALALAKELDSHRLEVPALVGLGSAYRIVGQYTPAIQAHKQSLELARQTLDRLMEAKSLQLLGADWLASGNSAKAEAPLLESLKIYESLRANLKDADKVSIFETQQRAYITLQQTLIAANKPEAALEIAERGRARAFVELLERRLATKAGIAATPITNPTIAQIKQIAKAENATLVQYSIIEPEFSTASNPQKPATEIYIWVVQPTGQVTFRRSNLALLPEAEPTSLAEYVAQVRLTTLGTRGLGVSFKESARDRPIANNRDHQGELKKLYQLLIQPISDLLPPDPNQHVIFIPQGALFLVPFSALLDASNQYLIERHTILTAPSIQVLELTRQQHLRQGVGSGQGAVGKDTPRSLLPTPSLIVGNPTMPKIAFTPGEPAEQLPALPGAEAEAKSIAQLLQATALIGNQATETRVVQQMQTANLIHLATHGLLDEQQGLGSAIALAPSSQDNGLLTADEILNFNLKAALVVLSACDTGRGRITGDGVIGLSRALIAAGAPSVIVSLWSVPDAPTASLMTQFYQNWQQNPDKAQALRQAMLKTLRQYPNPRDWAAFTLIGEPE